MVAPRRVIALPTDAGQRQRLLEISRSRTEPASRVERARIILAYLEDPSAYGVAQLIGVTHQTVTRCLERAAELGVIEALDDRPRTGRDPVIAPEAKPGWWRWPARSRRSWAIRTSCGQRGCWPRMPVIRVQPRGTRACPNWPRERCARSSPTTRSSRTSCAISWKSAIPSSSPRWRKSRASTAKWRCCASLGRAWPAPGRKWTAAWPSSPLAIISYDETPSIQAIGTTAPDLPPLPGRSPAVMRDHAMAL